MSQKARKMVMQEIEAILKKAQQAMANGTLDPQAGQQEIMQVQQNMQDPAQIEQMISIQMEKVLEEIMPQMMPQGNSPMDDPLVQIRMQELALKEKDLVRKTEEDQGQMMIELQRLQQRSASDAARIESQEEIAEERNVVNRERIDVQRDKMQQG